MDIYVIIPLIGYALVQIPDAIFHIFAYVRRRFYRPCHENQRMESKIDSDQKPNDTTVGRNSFAKIRKDGKFHDNISSDKENTVQTIHYIEETSTIEIEDENQRRIYK